MQGRLNLNMAHIALFVGPRSAYDLHNRSNPPPPPFAVHVAVGVVQSKQRHVGYLQHVMPATPGCPAPHDGRLRVTSLCARVRHSKQHLPHPSGNQFAYTHVCPWGY